MATILPKKSQTESPIATDDDAHAQLIADPAIQQFPQIATAPESGFGSILSATAPMPTSFGSPSPMSTGFGGGFSGSSSFNQPSSNSSFSSTTNINQSNSNQPVLTGAASTNAASGADVLVANDNTDWINKKWRPVMGWMYMVVCMCDFVVFPILWSLLQALNHGQVNSQWQPLTLQGAGLFHIAMGAVLGIAAYGRTKEKVAGTA
jgi:hypothetical protein